MTDTQTSTPVALQIGDFVRVKSIDDRDWRFSWDSRPYNLPSNGEVLMPFECAALWFGDPRSSSNVMSIKNEQGLVSWVGDRATEVRRLRTKYDNQFGDETQIVNAPHVEVYDLDNNRIYTVLDDPNGETSSIVSTTIADQNTLMATVQRQERLIRMLMEQQGMDPDADPNALATQPRDMNQPLDDGSGLDENGDPFDLNEGGVPEGGVVEGGEIPEDNGNA